MQPANAGYHPYQFPYYSPPVSHDHELKKQYLALLPPQQIIEICLTFEIHVPPYVKSTVWPLDINAAIVALRKSTPDHGESSPKADVHPAMGSLNNAAESVSPSDVPGKKPDEPQPPDKSVSNASEPQSVNRQTPTLQPPYPHQPYGFQQPHAGYPHATYYGHPPAGFPPYPSYPYQPFPPQHPPPPPASQSNPSSTNAPLHHPHAPQPQDAFREQPSADDLPSYEEMIVEALAECGDSEGCAPKELFTWMASRYPLQSNFRPSASQALQKAFKRGRFEKSRGGKYRLNATWEGGNTSRRTTRRPQTHTQNQAIASTNLAPQSSPFTHAPLVHHPKFSTSPSALPQSQSQPHQPSPFGLPYPPLPGYPTQPPSSTAEAQFLRIDLDTDIDATPANAYEAAQHILQAINFGELLKMTNEEDKSSVCTNSETPSVAPPILATAPPSTTDAPGVRHRAELQAMLALLAAQLAEIAHADEEDEGAVKDNELPVAVVVETPPLPPPPATSDIPDPGRQEEEDSDEDMEEVI